MHEDSLPLLHCVFLACFLVNPSDIFTLALAHSLVSASVTYIRLLNTEHTAVTRQPQYEKLTQRVQSSILEPQPDSGSLYFFPPVLPSKFWDSA